MHIPVWVLSILVITTLSMAGFGFRYLLAQIKFTRIELKSVQKSIATKVERNEAKFIKALEKLADRTVPMSYCDGKQELWNERIINVMTANKTEHDHIVKSMESLSSNVAKLSTLLHNGVASK